MNIVTAAVTIFLNHTNAHLARDFDDYRVDETYIYASNVLSDVESYHRHAVVELLLNDELSRVTLLLSYDLLDDELLVHHVVLECDTFYAVIHDESGNPTLV